MMKSSPARSVWSLYKVNDDKLLEEQKVLNLKKTNTVKLTDDPSRFIEDSLNQELLANPIKNDKGIPIEGKAGDEEEKEEFITYLSEANKSKEVYYSKRSWELWSMFDLSFLNSSSDVNSRTSGNGSTAVTGDQKSIDIVIGLEKYFIHSPYWYSRFSFYPLFQYYKKDSTTLEGDTIKMNFFAFGGGLNFFPLAKPNVNNSFIPYFGGSFGFGVINEVFVSSVNSQLDTDVKGRLNFFTVGIGAKYFVSWGLGMRMALDYYQRAETYQFEDGDNSKKINGPRLLVGLSYRW